MKPVFKYILWQKNRKPSDKTLFDSRQWYITKQLHRAVILMNKQRLQSFYSQVIFLSLNLDEDEIILMMFITMSPQANSEQQKDTQKFQKKSVVSASDPSHRRYHESHEFSSSPSKRIFIAKDF